MRLKHNLVKQIEGEILYHEDCFAGERTLKNKLWLPVLIESLSSHPAIVYGPSGTPSAHLCEGGIVQSAKKEKKITLRVVESSQCRLTLTDRLRPSFSGLSNSKMTDPFGPPVDQPLQESDLMGETECLIRPERWYIQHPHPSKMISLNTEKFQATSAIKKVARH
jgi:hypothetical protein